MFYKVSKFKLSRDIKRLGVENSEELIHNLEKYIATNFFELAGVRKKFEPESTFGYFSKDLINHIIINSDIMLPTGDDFRVPGELMGEQISNSCSDFT